MLLTPPAFAQEWWDIPLPPPPDPPKATETNPSDIAHRNTYTETRAIASTSTPNLEDAVKWQAEWDTHYSSAYDTPVFTPPPTGAVVAINQGLDKQIQEREEQIWKLRQGREAWRIALENLHRRDRDRLRELDFWVEESQLAQIGALMASVRLLVGNFGPVSHAIEVHGYNKTHLFRKMQELKPRLDQVRALLANAGRRGRNTRAIERAVAELTKQYDELVLLFTREVELYELFDRLQNISDRVLKAVTWLERLEGVSEAAAREDLLLAQKFLQDMMVDILKDAGLDVVYQKLEEANLEGAGRWIRLGNFVIEYGYQSVRFYLAWSHVHWVLTEVEDKTWRERQIRERIVLMTDRVNSLNSELGSLRATREGTDEEKKSKVLSEMRAMSNYQAWHNILGWLSWKAGSR